jgi:hypothetical protein
MARDKKKDDQKPDINVSIGGDVKGKLTVAGGDIVEGDKITVGNITDSSGVVIGGKDVTVDLSQVTAIFDQVREKIEELPIPQEQKEEAQVAVDQIEQEAQAPEPDVDRLDRWLGVLEEIAPTIAEILVNALTNPGSAVSSGLRAVIRAIRRGRRGEE